MGCGVFNSRLRWIVDLFTCLLLLFLLLLLFYEFKVLPLLLLLLAMRLRENYNCFALLIRHSFDSVDEFQGNEFPKEVKEQEKQKRTVATTKLSQANKSKKCNKNTQIDTVFYSCYPPSLTSVHNPCTHELLSKGYSRCCWYQTRQGTRTNMHNRSSRQISTLIPLATFVWPEDNVHLKAIDCRQFVYRHLCWLEAPGNETAQLK